MAKKKGIFSAILKLILGLLGVIVLVVVGGYCYLKFALGIDVIDITKKLNLISSPVSESQIVSNSFEKEDGVDILSNMFGSNDIVTKDGDKYTFNIEAYAQADLQIDPMLSDSDVASLFALFVEGVDANTIGIDKELVKYITLKQIKFSNLVVSSDATSVDVNYIFAADLVSVKKDAAEQNAIISFLVNKFVPDKLYLSSTFNIQLPKDNYQEYTTTTNSFVLNNLNQEQTNGVLDVLSIFSSEDLKVTLSDKLNTMFCDALFGGNGNKGLVGNIKSVASVEFVEDIENIKIFIKKV